MDGEPPDNDPDPTADSLTESPQGTNFSAIPTTVCEKGTEYVSTLENEAPNDDLPPPPPPPPPFFVENR